MLTQTQKLTIGGRPKATARPAVPVYSAQPQVPTCLSNGPQAQVQEAQQVIPSRSSWAVQQQGLQQCCAAVAAAMVLVTGTCFDASAAMAPLAYSEDEANLSPAMQEALKREEAKYDENLMTADLRSFMELLGKKGSSIKAEELVGPRSKLGFRRAADGRVSLKARDGHWYSVKADMQTPGFLLLRDESDGSMYFLPPDDSGQLMQIDLSDDAVVAQLFASGAWYDVMDPLKVREGNRLIPLQLSEAQFRLTTSLLQDAEEEDLAMMN